METILNAPMIAEPLGLFDCCGVSDGAACAIVTTPGDRARAGQEGPGHDQGASSFDQLGHRVARPNTWDGSHVRNTRNAAERAYAEAGITDPREQLGLMEVHDCFSITELVTMEDLFISEDGRAVQRRAGRLLRPRRQGVPCQIDGGLKCFGHPIGASGLRMAYEVYNQLLGRAGERQLGEPVDRADAQSRRRAVPGHRGDLDPRAARVMLLHSPPLQADRAGDAAQARGTLRGSSRRRPCRRWSGPASGCTWPGRAERP